MIGSPHVLGRTLADLVLPRVCAGCGHPGHVLCPPCAALLARPRPATPRRHPHGFPPTVAAGEYAGPVRPAVNAFKEHARTELAGPLGAALALAVGAVQVASGRRDAVVLVPLPSSRSALRVRGRDPVAELAAAAVRELRRAGVPATVVAALGRRGRVQDSAGLGSEQRRANLAGTVVLREPSRRLPGLVVLVDDVVSSGATLTEAATALAPALAPAAAGGDTPVVAAVVAATPRGRARPPVPGGAGVFTVRDVPAAGFPGPGLSDRAVRH
ncbi:Predicted amidophosphoribosyltransferases [Klenkia marina]|uniref:Predicted amidophosphoribosyltransferases n=1 Tax=Klenkia marina TaxID=1960309 RepID=A0A1G4YEF5_9ACTN|nr:phosphoribosyltransferase [Klenkia marina]SCX51921.1 Predicted amidophosphoribosyltransferases [Klenkia marina]